MKPQNPLSDIGFYTVMITEGLSCLVLNKAGDVDPISITSALHNVLYETHMLIIHIRSQVPSETS